MAKIIVPGYHFLKKVDPKKYRSRLVAPLAEQGLVKFFSVNGKELNIKEYTN